MWTVCRNLFLKSLFLVWETTTTNEVPILTLDELQPYAEVLLDNLGFNEYANNFKTSKIIFPKNVDNQQYFTQVANHFINSISNTKVSTDDDTGKALEFMARKILITFTEQENNIDADLEQLLEDENIHDEQTTGTEQENIHGDADTPSPSGRPRRATAARRNKK